MRTPSSKKEDGFTLIELIIVIVILGILAVTAAPRFIDISSEANAASLQAFKGAIESSNRIVYGKAMIQGVHKQAIGDVDLGNGSTVSVQYGYITYDDLDRTNGGQQIAEALNVTLCHHLASEATCANADWRFDIDSDHIKFYHSSIGQDPSGSNFIEPLCYVRYNLASDENTPPSYDVQTADC